jgi:hypothetical protein
VAIVNLFHKRQRQLRGEQPDVYNYDELPNELRVQIVQIWMDVLGHVNVQDSSGKIYRLYETIVKIMRKELGVFQLPNTTRHDNVFQEWFNGFLTQEDVEIALSMVELAGRGIEHHASEHGYRYLNDSEEVAQSAIAEINARFQEHGVGYQFTDGEIVRVDSELIHTEVVKPALSLLRAGEFVGAQAEFLKAHEKYRHGDTKGALTECHNALESVIKVICNKRGWTYDAKANSKTLIGVLFEKKLIPDYWQSHFSGLRTTLESGVPTARNKDSGHGQGLEIKTVPLHLAGYVLHQTAAAIVFLVEAERALG